MEYKAASTVGELRSQTAALFASAMNGTLDEKRGRLALKAAGVTAELYQAETRSRMVASQVNETVIPFGQQPIGGAI
jgi:hypothetical protein